MRQKCLILRGSPTVLVFVLFVFVLSLGSLPAKAQPAETQPAAAPALTWTQAMEEDDWPAAQTLLEAAIIEAETEDELVPLYHNLATVYRVLGDLEAAETVLEALLKIEESPETIEELGAVKTALGDWSAAEDLLGQALALREAREGPSEASIELLQNLARVLVAEEKFAEAEADAQAAIDLRTELFGADIPNLEPDLAADLAADYAVLARVLQAQKKWMEAAEEWETVIRIQAEAFGNQDLRLAATLDNLATCREELHEVDQAEAALRRALAIRESESGRNSASVAATADSLGSLLFDAERFDDAEPMFRRSLNIYLDLLGSDNAMIARNYDNLAVTLAKLERYEEAETMYRAALKLRDVADVESLRNLALVLQTTNQEEESADLYRRALAVIEAYPYQRPKLQQSILSEYLRLLRELGRTREASRIEQEHLPRAPSSKGGGAGSRSK